MMFEYSLILARSHITPVAQLPVNSWVAPQIVIDHSQQLMGVVLAPSDYQGHITFHISQFRMV